MKLMKSVPALIALLSTLLFASPALAGGGFGSVRVVSTTDSSITIDWSDPSGNIKYASDPPTFEVCYKKEGAWIGSCAGGEVRLTTSRPFTLMGLEDAESYKVKVTAYTYKKNLFGKWKNPKFRKVGTLTQSTPASVSPTPSGNIEFIGATQSSAAVPVDWSHPSLLERIVLCYKKTWYPDTLEAGCADWSNNNQNFGKVVVSAPVTTNDVFIDGLSDCRQYKFAAFAFFSGGGSVQIGQKIKGHTAGSCKTSLFSEFLDVDDLLPVDYVDEVEAFYGTSLSDHILAQNPHLGREHVILDRSGENVSAPLNLLEYLNEAHPEVVEAWQGETALQDAGLAVEQFLAVRDPEMLRVLQEDLAADEVLSLSGDRFEVYVTWTTPDGGTGAGQPVPLTGDTGYFWFFDRENVELVVKVLDACTPFDRFWVFAAGLTNVAVDVTVVDTATETTFEFSNPQGVAFQPVQATDAFATCP